MADLGRISGPMLKANLERLGVDLVFENQFGDNNLYLDVNSRKIGINTNAMPRELTVDGTLGTIGLIVDNDAQLTNLYLDGDTGTITSYTGDVTIQATGTLFADILETPSLIFNDNYIQGVISNENIELVPHGTGKVLLDGNAVISGNVQGDSNLIIKGDITFGNDINTDTVNITTEIAGNLDPKINEVYNIGRPDKKWDELHSELVNGEFLITEDLTAVANVNSNAAKRPGNSYFVSTLGVDSGIWNDGTHQLGGFRTIKHALSFATAGDTVTIYPGVYQETFPLEVPEGVTVNGTNIRTVIIEPDSSSEFKDCFLLNAGSTVSNLTVRDFFYNSSTDEGYGFRFAPNYDATERSPYVQNITVITKEIPNTLLPGAIYVDPEGLGLSFDTYGVTVSKSGHSEALVQSWVGKTMATYFGPSFPVTFYTITGYEPSVQDPTQLWNLILAEPFNPLQQGFSFSIYPSGTTFILPPNDYDMTGASIGEPWVAYFKTNLPLDFNTVVGQGWSINNNGVVYVIDYVIQDPINTNMWRIYVTTSLVPASGIPIFSSPSGSAGAPAGRGALVDGSNAVPQSITASMLFHSVTFIVPNSVGLYMTNGVRVEWLNSFTYFASKGLYATNGSTGRLSPDGSTMLYGAELRSIGSANVYGLVGAEGDGSSVLMYLINHNFAYIGTGTSSINDDTAVVQADETVTINGARIYWQSDDHKGNFRVGEAFFVNQETGFVTFNGIGQSVSGINEIIFSAGDDITILNAERIETGDVVFQGNLLSTATGDLNIKSALAPQTLQTSNIAGNLDVTGNISIDGTINIGNAGAIDTVTFASEVDSDIIPKFPNSSSLGITALAWNSIWLGQADFNDIVINDNKIYTTTSNSNLELYAAGTGKVVFNALQVETGFDAVNIVNLDDINIIGTFSQTGNQTRTGNTTITGDYQLSNTLTLSVPSLSFGDISVDSNVISTVQSNADLQLLASGTGNIYVPINDVQVDNDLIYNVVNSNNIQTILATSDIFDAGVKISGNVIETPTPDLIINAAGTGKVKTDSVLIDQDLTVIGTTTLKSTTVDSIVSTAQITLTGNSQIIGDVSVTNNLSVNYSVFKDVSIQGNVITTTIGNNDLLLRAAGSGNVVFQENVLVDNNTIVQNNTSANAATIATEVSSSQMILDGVTITGNVIESNDLNNDLVLDPNGILQITGTDVAFNTALTVAGSTTLSDLSITGLVTHTNNLIRTGDVEITGSTSIQQSLAVSGYAQFQNLRIDGNRISSSANIELSAQPSRIVIFNDNLVIDNNLDIGADLFSDDLTVRTQATGLSIFADDILVQENFITTTASNADLELRANGTGSVNITDNFKIINAATISGTTTLSNTDITDLVLIGQLNQTGNINQLGNVSIIGDISSDVFTNGDILITGNTIATTSSDSDIELLASGGIGNIVVPNSNVVIENDLTVNDAYIAVQNITFPNDVTSDVYESDQVRIQNNYIETYTSNTDLELAAHGTGRVTVQPTLEIPTGQFNLTGNSTFPATDIVGTFGLTGTKQHTGTFNLSGEYNLTGNLITNGQALFEDYNFIDFRIATTTSNSNVDLRAAGSGKVIFNDSVLLSQDLTVFGDILSRNITGTTIVTDTISDGDIRIKDNFIETTLSNSNLHLLGSGTGSVILEKTRITNNIISTVDTNSNLNVTPLVGQLVDFDKTNAIKLPAGTSLNKLTGVTGELRFNTSVSRFEGWTNNGSITYGGIFSRNRATSVRALDTDVLDFRINNVSRMSINSTTVNLTALLTGSLIFSGNTISSTSNSNINLDPNGTGEVVMGDILFTGTTLTNTDPTENMVLQNTGSGYVKFNTTTALVIPTGDTSSRPLTPEVGDIRFNTDLSAPEVFNGIAYSTLAGNSTNATLAEIQELNEIYAILLG